MLSDGNESDGNLFGIENNIHAIAASEICMIFADILSGRRGLVG